MHSNGKLLENKIDYLSRVFLFIDERSDDRDNILFDYDTEIFNGNDFKFVCNCVATDIPVFVLIFELIFATKSNSAFKIDSTQIGIHTQFDFQCKCNWMIVVNKRISSTF